MIFNILEKKILFMVLEGGILDKKVFTNPHSLTDILFRVKNNSKNDFVNVTLILSNHYFFF